MGNSDKTGSFEGAVEVYEPLALDRERRLQVDERTVCKFLLVKHNGRVDLVCGPVKEYTYHAMLLDRYCRDNEIAASWVKQREYLEVYDSALEVRGGGWLEIRPDRQLIRIFGASTAYGGFDRRVLNLLLADQTVFAEFSVHIE